MRIWTYGFYFVSYLNALIDNIQSRNCLMYHWSMLVWAGSPPLPPCRCLFRIFLQQILLLLQNCIQAQFSATGNTLVWYRMICPKFEKKITNFIKTKKVRLQTPYWRQSNDRNRFHYTVSWSQSFRQYQERNLGEYMHRSHSTFHLQKHTIKHTFHSNVGIGNPK